jgi:hypothetical protein
MSNSDIGSRVDEIGAVVESLSEEVRRLSVARVSVPRCLPVRDEVVACKDVLRNVERICTPCALGDIRLQSVVATASDPLIFGGVLSMAQCQAFLSSRLCDPMIDMYDFVLRVFRRLTGLYIRESRPIDFSSVVVLVCKFGGRVVFATLRGGVRNTWPYYVHVEFPDVPVMTYVRSGVTKTA